MATNLNVSFDSVAESKKISQELFDSANLANRLAIAIADKLGITSLTCITYTSPDKSKTFQRLDKAAIQLIWDTLNKK